MVQHLFITGGTGLVGRFVVRTFLERFPGARCTLLIRASNAGERNARCAAIASWAASSPGVVDAAARLDALAGDVGEEDLGMSQADRTAVIRSATHLVHAAATIRFDTPIEEARAVNREGTRRMLALARTCAAQGRLQRMVYVGSSSVSGRREGTIREEELEQGQEFFNTYERSKAESERLVRESMPEIPLTVVRPSIIVGDSATGYTPSFVVIYIPLRLLERGLLTAVPGDPRTLMDLVPVDWVARALLHAMEHPDGAGKVLHLTAGPSRAVRLGRLVEHAAAYFDRHAPRDAPRRVRFVSPDEYRRLRSELQGRQAMLLAQLDTLFPYVSVNRLFDTTQADALLAGSGISFPRFEEYAERILGYCLATRWGKTAAL